MNIKSWLFEELREATFRSFITGRFESLPGCLEGGAPMFLNPILEGFFLLRRETFDLQSKSG
jgi:hypothetical protein